jgi:tetratricopeptide (TPR) repeat protein
VEQKKQYLSTIQLEKQRIQNFTLKMVYENAYDLYRRGDYQRAQELANVILSIDPSLTKAQTLATEAGRMAAYGTISEDEIISMKFEEAISLYKAGRLVESRSKFEEILVLRPREERAKEWIRRIDNEIAEQHIKRGYFAYKNTDYKEALNQWYSALLIRKEDEGLASKIGEVEDLLKKDENQKILNNAFDLYSKGKLIAAYQEFQRSLEIQPGEKQTQRFLIQLKDEIAQGYYDAGDKAIKSYKYKTAVANWKEAKNWGYNQSDISVLIKNAERNRIQAEEEAKRKALAAAQKPVPVDEGEETAAEPSGKVVTKEPQEAPVTQAPLEDLPTKVITEKDNKYISDEARAASREHFQTGMKYYYNDKDYERAKEEWQIALQLNPENLDAAAGLKKIEEQYSSR